MINRRSVLAGLIAGPAVVKFASLMPVRGIIMPRPDSAEVVFVGDGWLHDWLPAQSYEPGQVVKTIADALHVVKDGGLICCHHSHVEYCGRSFMVDVQKSVLFKDAHFQFKEDA